MHNSTTGDALRNEAVDIAVDVTSMMVRFREKVRPDHSYVLAMECCRIADKIQKARDTALPWIAKDFFEEGRTCAVRSMIALDRAGAHTALPGPECRALNRRLHDMALALGALAGETTG